jgi:hypothetical protein
MVTGIVARERAAAQPAPVAESASQVRVAAVRGSWRPADRRRRWPRREPAVARDRRFSRALRRRFSIAFIPAGWRRREASSIYCRYEQKLPYFRFNSRMEDGEPVRV